MVKIDLLVPKVTALVIKHVPLRPEALTAILWARIGPFILVDSDVDLEVLLLTEGLVATREWTLKGLRPIMNMHVGLKTNLTFESLIAAGFRTEEELRWSRSTGWTPRTIIFVFLFCMKVL